MATTFFLRTKRKKGYAPVCIRVQSSVLKINIRQSTNLMVAIQKWNLSRSSRNFKNFLYSPEGYVLFEKLEEIRLTIDKKIKGGVSVTAEQVREIVQAVVYREQMKKPQCMNLNAYIAMYQEQAEQGIRKTQKGTAFSPGTLKSVRLARKQFEIFQCFYILDFSHRPKLDRLLLLGFHGKSSLRVLQTSHLSDILWVSLSLS